MPQLTRNVSLEVVKIGRKKLKNEPSPIVPSRLYTLRELVKIKIKSTKSWSKIINQNWTSENHHTLIDKNKCSLTFTKN